MTIRFARHTNNLELIKSFYIDILGLELLGGFENHNGYDGIFIGLKNEKWHLEFTSNGEEVHSNFNDDDLLVFYPKSVKEYDFMIQNLKMYNIKPLKPKNPYWVENGILFLDPDGYRILISNLKINNEFNY